MHPPRSEGRIARWLHRLFGATLLIKGSLAASEALTGLALLVTANGAILGIATWLTRNELAQDPQEGWALWVERAAAAFPIETQHFYAFYLLAHGGLKLGMVLLLARRVMWAYPASVVVLAGFIAYQLNHWSHTHATALLVLSGLDALMIGLVIREYRALRAANAAGGGARMALAARPDR